MKTKRSITYLEYRRSVRRAPRVQQVVLAGGDEPLAAGRESQRQHARFVQVELIFVGIGGMQHLDVRVLHADGQPFARGTVAEREYLRREVVLLQLSALA